MNIIAPNLFEFSSYLASPTVVIILLLLCKNKMVEYNKSDVGKQILKEEC